MDDRSTAISAAEVADDRAEIAAAVKVAKAFRDKLEGVGSSYHKPLQSGGDIQAPAGYAPRGFPESEWPPGLLARMDDGRRPHESVSFLLPGVPNPDDHDARRGGRAAVP